MDIIPRGDGPVSIDPAGGARFNLRRQRRHLRGNIVKSALPAPTGLALALSLSLGAPVHAQSGDAPPPPGSPVFERTGAAPMIDFAGLQAQLGGEPTRILVLGTTHLNQLPEEAFDPSHLSLVMERLEAFAPDIIAIEAIGGRNCEQLRSFPELYPGVADRYCWEPDLALESLEMSQAEAASAAEETLRAWPDAPSAQDRRRLAALLYGAGEPWSAALQWARLDPAERLAADGISEALIARLDRHLASRNENRLMGVELGDRLGLETLAAMDDHSADIIQARAPEALGPAIRSVWGAEHPLEAEYDGLRATFLGSPEGVRDGYLFLNSEPYQRFVIENDFGLAAATSEDSAVTRHYVAWWQARGLRMAANVIEATGNQPGARVLVIVGASHKAYFDAYLDQMHDIELVSVEEVLAD